MKPLLLLFFFIFIFFLPSCGGDQYPKRKFSDARYASDWGGIKLFLEERCSNCHGYSPGVANIQFPEDLEKDLNEGAGKFVVANDSSKSIFWLVLSQEENDLTTSKMLPYTDTFHNEVILPIKEWIDDGAAIN